MAISIYDSKSNPDTMFGLSKEKNMTEAELKNEVIHAQEKHRKIATDTGTAQLYVAEKKATMTVEDNGFAVSEAGIVLAGRTHLTRTPEEIRVGGFWVLNPHLLTTLPSTLYTPIQTLIYSDPPYAKQVSSLAKISTKA